MKHLTILTCTLVCLLFSSCYQEDDYNIQHTNISDVIQNVSPDSVKQLANGIDKTNIVVQVPPEANPALSKVTFTTLNGVFENGLQEITVEPQLRAGPHGNVMNAWVIFQSGQVAGIGNIRFSIATANMSQTIPLVLENNPPDSIKLIPESIYMQQASTSELNIVASLSSKKGKVSTGQAVLLTVKDTVGNTRGSIRINNYHSTIDQQCSYKWSILPDTGYSGKLILSASNGHITSDPVNLYILK